MEEKAQYRERESEFELGPCNAESLQTAFNAGQTLLCEAHDRLETAMARLRQARETLALNEAILIDEWLGNIPPSELKTQYGSNAEDRERNTLIYLSRIPSLAADRENVSTWEREVALSKNDPEAAREYLQNLRSLA